MQKICTGLVFMMLLMLMPFDQAQAGRRRHRHRQRCSPCIQYAPCCQAGCPDTPTADPAGTNCPRSYSFFPDVCPMAPNFPDANGVWTWDAERHYGEGKNCNTCFVEATSMTGDYDLYGLWPYACGHEKCEPSTNGRPRAVDYPGRRLHAQTNPVNMAFDPISDMPRGANAREISPRRYVSFVDTRAGNRVRYFIVYSIRVYQPRKRVSRDIHFGHEVPAEELREVQDLIRPIEDKQVGPLDRFGSPQNDPSYVYAVKNQDGRNEFMLYLNRD